MASRLPQSTSGTYLLIVIFLLIGITFVVGGIASRTVIGEGANLVFSSVGVDFDWSFYISVSLHAIWIAPHC